MHTEVLDFSAADGLMILAAYLVGSISPGYLLVRLLRGIDLRTVHSGSLGARNTGRVLGPRGFYITLVFDILKGFVMVMLARVLGFSSVVAGIVVIAVIAGHVWPFWLKFHGGKGIATSLGAFGALDLAILVTGGAVLLVTYLVTRTFSVSWIATLVAMPLVALLLDRPVHIVLPLLVSTAIILIAHRDNIKRMLSAADYKQ